MDKYSGYSLYFNVKLTPNLGTVKELSGQLDTPHVPHLPTPNSSHTTLDGNTPARSLFGRAVVEHTVSDTASKDEGTRVEQVEETFGTLVLSDRGTTRYLNRNYWSRVVEEVRYHRTPDILSVLLIKSTG